MKLLHLSDFHHGNPHLAPQDPASLPLKKSLPLRERLERCKKSLAGDIPDALLLSGDFSMDGNPDDIRQLIQEIHSLFPGLPMAFVPGNHDHPLASFKDPSDFFDSPSLCRVLSLQGLPVICLDTSRPGSDQGLIDRSQCQWLKQQLVKLNQQPAILMTHFHLLPQQHTMPCASYPEEFAEMVATSSLIGIFTGHTHCHYQGFFAGKPYCTAPGFSFYGRPSASGKVSLDPCFGYNLYTIENGQLTQVKTETFYLPFVCPESL